MLESESSQIVDCLQIVGIESYLVYIQIIYASNNWLLYKNDQLGFTSQSHHQPLESLFQASVIELSIQWCLFVLNITSSNVRSLKSSVNRFPFKLFISFVCKKYL